MSSSAVDDADQRSMSSHMRSSGCSRAAGQADLDPARARVAIVLDRPAQQASAEPEFAALPSAQPAVKCGHARLERDVHDPLE
jgi:hypothetical protein